jgi:hypothetical protein
MIDATIVRALAGSGLADTTLQMPLSAQRRNCRKIEFQLPNSSGRSRHGAPVRINQNTPSSTRRWLCGGRPPRQVRNGSKYAMVHVQSERVWRPRHGSRTVKDSAPKRLVRPAAGKAFLSDERLSTPPRRLARSFRGGPPDDVPGTRKLHWTARPRRLPRAARCDGPPSRPSRPRTRTPEPRASTRYSQRILSLLKKSIWRD